MLLKFTDDENKPVLVDSDSIVLVAQASNNENIRIISAYAGGFCSLVHIGVKESIDEILKAANIEYE